VAGKETSYLVRHLMLVTLRASGVGSLIAVFKVFQGDGEDRSTELKVCWYKGFGTLDDLGNDIDGRQ